MQLSEAPPQRPPPPAPALEGLPSLEHDAEERPSITEVNGTVAHFEMAYNPNPEDRFAFGPPLWQRLPSLLFMGFAGFVGVMAFVAHHSAAGTALHKFVVAENRTPLAFIIALAAIATFVRSGLRGVIITRDSVETRTLAMGFPRVKKYGWAQIDRVVLDKEDVLFELWNGQYERLPKVRDGEKMVDLLERIAIGRGRQVTRLDRKR